MTLIVEIWIKLLEEQNNRATMQIKSWNYTYTSNHRKYKATLEVGIGPKATKLAPLTNHINQVIMLKVE